MNKSRYVEKNLQEIIQTNLSTQKLETKFPHKKPACTKMMTERLVSSNSEQLDEFDASTVDVESPVLDKVH